MMLISSPIKIYSIYINDKIYLILKEFENNFNKSLELSIRSQALYTKFCV